MGKRKRDDRTLEIKYKALVELEKGKTNKDVAKLFDIPPNTLSTWKKNKVKIFEAFINQNESYSVFTTFGDDLRKTLCDTTQIVERAHIANTKQSNIDQFFQ